jgi:two-component sensor histidine kinase
MSFRERYEHQPVKAVRWNVVVYSIVLSEVITALVSLLWGRFIPELFIMGFIAPLMVAPGMMVYSYKLREKLIKQLIQSEELLRASLAEKEVLMREVHHRVKNNMAVVTGFLRLQSRYTKDPEAIRILKESQDRIRSMALVHEKLQLEEGHVRINLENYVRGLLNGLLNSYNVTERQVHYALEVEDIFLDIKTTIPCGLIINELVTNSLKYAFKDAESPEIRVGLRSDGNGELMLNVSDNGCGIPSDADLLGGKSLGMKIVDSLVSQIDGTLHVDTTGGTAFHVRFKEPAEEGGA